MFKNLLNLTILTVFFAFAGHAGHAGHAEKMTVQQIGHEIEALKNSDFRSYLPREQAAIENRLSLLGRFFAERFLSLENAQEARESEEARIKNAYDESFSFFESRYPGTRFSYHLSILARRTRFATAAQIAEAFIEFKENFSSEYRTYENSVELARFFFSRLTPSMRIVWENSSIQSNPELDSEKEAHIRTLLSELFQHAEKFYDWLREQPLSGRVLFYHKIMSRMSAQGRQDMRKKLDLLERALFPIAPPSASFVRTALTTSMLEPLMQSRREERALDEAVKWFQIVIELKKTPIQSGEKLLVGEMINQNRPMPSSVSKGIPQARASAPDDCVGLLTVPLDVQARRADQFWQRALRSLWAISNDI